MRLLMILPLILVFGILTVRADTLVVTGVLLDSDKTTRAAGYTVKIYAGRPGAGDSSDPTSTFGVYTVVKENVDSGTISSWYLICDENNKKAYKKLAFERKPNNIWQAKVEDLALVSTNKTGYSAMESSETIYIINAVQAVKARSGELTPAAANEMASAEAARVLGNTDLGNDPNATLLTIGNSARNKSEANMVLPMLRPDTFLLLRHRPEFKQPLFDPRKESQMLTCIVCIRLPQVVPDNSRTGKNERCERVAGRTREEVRALAATKVCGANSDCVRASANSNNVTVHCPN